MSTTPVFNPMISLHIWSNSSVLYCGNFHILQVWIVQYEFLCNVRLHQVQQLQWITSSFILFSSHETGIAPSSIAFQIWINGFRLFDVASGWSKLCPMINTLLHGCSDFLIPQWMWRRKLNMNSPKISSNMFCILNTLYFKNKSQLDRHNIYK